MDGDQPLLFIANPVNEELRTTVTLPNMDGGFVAWDPVTLQRHALGTREGGDGFDVRLPPYGSLFILRGEADPTSRQGVVTEVAGEWTLTIPGSDPLQLTHATHWTDPEIGAEHFSGTATYVVEFQLDGPELPHAIQFADIADVAQHQNQRRRGRNSLDCSLPGVHQRTEARDGTGSKSASPIRGATG